MGKKKNNTGWRFLLMPVVVLAVLFFCFNIFFQFFRIPTTSMIPALEPGDFILVSKAGYGLRLPFIKRRLLSFANPSLSDVLVFQSPQDNGEIFVKRLIAAGEDSVSIREGNVYINGKQVLDPNISRNYYYSQGSYPQAEGFEVPAGYYFFLGDNSIASDDSRFWGAVSEDNIIGKALFIWWPPDRINMVD